MRHYILDTNVLLHDPESLSNFKENIIIIPIGVLEELDKFKKEYGELGKNSRDVCRKLDALREKGDLREGVDLDNGYGGKVKVLYNSTLDGFCKEKNVDYHILQIAQTLKTQNPNIECVIVSRDTNVRIRANAAGLIAEDYESSHVTEEIDRGFSEAKCDLERIAVLLNDRKLEIEDCMDFFKEGAEIIPNYYFVLKSDEEKARKGQLTSILAKVSPDKKFIEALDPVKDQVRLRPKNIEQFFVLDALMDERVKLVSIIGAAGSGKTLISVAAGYYLLNKTEEYYKMLIARPMVPMGNKDTMGFLPGPQPLDAKILTPDGWTTMGELKVGSKVITRDGSSVNVIGIFPKGEKDVFRVTTTDGTFTECCKDHLWLTQTAENRKRGKDGSVKTTQEIMNTLESKMSGKKLNSFSPRYGEIRPNHFLPRNSAVTFNQKDKFILSPYVLGCILGDGCIGDSVSIANVDQDIIDRCENELKEIGCSLRKVKNSISYTISSNFYNNKPERQVIITNLKDNSKIIYSGRTEVANMLGVSKLLINERCKNKSIINGEQCSYGLRERWRNTVRNELYKIGLDGKKAWDKFIPEVYKYSSIESRLALIQGLMDTDGTVNEKGCCTYFTCSLLLANDMAEVVRSLGGRAIIRSRNRIGKESKKLVSGKKITTKRISYEVSISLPYSYNPFYLRRKASRVKSTVIHGVGITKIEHVGKKEVQCILIDNPEHLYITDDFIVTHNTLEEKLDPWMQPIYDAFEVLMSTKKEIKDGREFVRQQKNIKIEPLAYIRGRSINDQFFILDESQNTSALEIKTIITRAGEGTKIILTGDIDQIDCPYMDKYSNGLTIATKAFIGSEIAAHIVMSKGVRSKLSEEASRRL